MHDVRQLLALLILLAICWGIFTGARSVARVSPRARLRMIYGSALAMIAAIVVLVWLPHQVPDTQGSPAGTVMILLMWMVGGLGLAIAIPSLVGAIVARPPNEVP